ncbi:MAG: hypothetical protein EA391_10900 [Balneolaceae bacterium]|nr:MAG: hypothetical protein EA391_10900 [Balneolaceae bacterium]
MKVIILFIAVVIAPVYLLAQTDSSKAKSLVINNHTDGKTQQLHIVEPILLRNILLKTEGSNRSFTESSAVPFFSSLVVPGTGQMINRNWWRSGIYLAVEAASIYLAIDYRNRGVRGERNYERWADQNWSVVQYSKWLVDYHAIHGINNPYLDDLRQMIEGLNPAFDTSIDWNRIDLAILRNVERNTPYITTDDLGASNFSHVLPDFGSQQYYELIAKYYQYQAGWRDYDAFHDNLGHTGNLFIERFRIERNGAFASPLFYDGVDFSRQFNEDFRRSGYFVSLLIANHIISAFDAYFTVQLKQNRLDATSTMLPGRNLVINYRF